MTLKGTNLWDGGGVKSDDYSVYYSSTYLSEIPSTFPSEDKTFYAIWFDTSLLSDGTMTIINPASTDIALTVTVSGTTITANCTHESSDLTEVSWYLDGVLQSDGDATETTISDVATGTHTLYVVASDGYETYTIRAKVTISE